MDTIPYLTTLDNPFDPRDEFRDWLRFDKRMGYNTTEIMDRHMHTSPQLSPADQEDSRRFAIEQVMENNIMGIHTVVWLPPD